MLYNMSGAEAEEELHRRLRPLIAVSDLQGARDVYRQLSARAQIDNKGDEAWIRYELREVLREEIRWPNRRRPNRFAHIGRIRYLRHGYVEEMR